MLGPFRQKIDPILVTCSDLTQRVSPIEFVSPLRPNTVDDGFVKPFRKKDLIDGFVKLFSPKNRPHFGDGFVNPLRQKIFAGVILQVWSVSTIKTLNQLKKKDVVLVLFKFIVNTFARYLDKKV